MFYTVAIDYGDNSRSTVATASIDKLVKRLMRNEGLTFTLEVLNTHKTLKEAKHRAARLTEIELQRDRVEFVLSDEVDYLNLKVTKLGKELAKAKKAYFVLLSSIGKANDYADYDKLLSEHKKFVTIACSPYALIESERLYFDKIKRKYI